MTAPPTIDDRTEWLEADGLGGFASSRGSDGGFNSGYTSSSGFTYDR